MWISIYCSTTYLKDHLFHHWLFLAPFSNIHWPYVVVQSLSYVQLFATQWTTAHCLSCPSPSPRACSNFCVLSVMPSNHLILCHSLLLLPSIFPSIRVFSNELVLRIRWPKHWSFSFSISPSNEYSGLISFRMDWLDLLVVQGTLKSLLYTTVWKHQFFGSQLSL